MDPLHAGDTVAGYILDAPLGHGGFGVVYRARDHLGRPLALKLSHRPFARLPSRELVWQQNEIEVLSRLEHDTVVKVLDHGWLPDGRIFLAMELVEGQTLYDWIHRQGRLEPLEALRIALAVTEGLVHSHGQGILHLDLKPANIVVVDRHAPRIKILDFGLAHLTEAWRSSRETTPGTPEFMPPEVFTERELTPDTSFDLYALGTMLYEMLSGRLPFTARTPQALADLKARGHFTPLAQLVPDLPPALDRLVQTLMAHRREDRPASAAQLQDVLRALIYGLLGEVVSGDAATAQAATVLPVRRAPVREAAQSAPTEAAFVGRTRELAGLRGAWRRACAEPGTARLVTAPSGVGKSRLVATFLDTFREHDAIIGYGRCREIAGVVPHAALREALGRIADRMRGLPEATRRAVGDALRRERVEIAVLTALVPEAGALLDALGNRDQTAPPELAATTLESTERVARAVRGLASAIAAVGVPLLIVIEDLHWGDEATLAVVRRLLELGIPRRCLLLATARPDAAARLPGFHELVLDPLDPIDNDAHLAALLGRNAPDIIDSLKARIPMLAVGNPLFNAQVVRDLILEGCIRTNADTHLELDAARLADYTPPDSVFDVVERALHRLPERATVILGVAALLGRRFRVDDLRAVELFDPDEIHTAIAHARKLGLVQNAPQGYAFTHDLIRTHIEAAIDPDLQIEIHARIARALQSRAAPASEQASHLDRAGEFERAAEAWLEAGLYAEACLDPRGAVRHLARSHALLLQLPPSASRDAALVRASFELARIAPGLGDSALALDAVNACREATRLEPGSEAAIGLDSALALLHYVHGDLDSVLAHCRQAMHLSSDTPLGRRYLVSPVNIMGRALCACGQFRAAATLLERGCRLAHEAGAWLELAHSRGMLALARGFLGQLDAARDLADDARRLAEQLGDPVRRVACLVYRALVAELTFEWNEGLKLCIEALQLAEHEDIDGIYVYLATLMAGRHQYHFGQLERARVLVSSALNLARLHNLNMVRGWAWAFLGDIHLLQGRLDDARDAYRTGLTIAVEIGDELGVPMCRIGLAHSLAMRDGAAHDPQLCAEFDRQAQAALDQLESAPNPRILLEALPRFAASLRALGRHDEAAAVALRQTRLLASLRLEPREGWPEPTPLPAQLPPQPAPTSTARRPSSRHSRIPLEESRGAGDTLQDIARAALEPDISWQPRAAPEDEP